MTNVCRNIFRAIHEGKWLSIEYKNKQEVISRCWISILKLDPQRKAMTVNGLHLGELKTQELYMYIDSIISAELIDGTYVKTNQAIIDDISKDPTKYRSLFTNITNMSVLSYLSACYKIDGTPYCCDYFPIKYLDIDKLSNSGYLLNNTQFEQIVRSYQYDTTAEVKKTSMRQIAMNLLSIKTDKGLYVLAYRRLLLDVEAHRLYPSKTITVCQEFTVSGSTQSIRRFLDAEDCLLVNDFEKNAERIKDLISASSFALQVDDMPYLISVALDSTVDLEHEYATIVNQYHNNTVSEPIKAFFGELVRKTRYNKREYPLALVNRQVNLDQMLAINHAFRYALTYVQGPPGTGKTNTILNVILTAFFNEQTVLFSSFNNHPIDSLFDKLSDLKYRDKQIPFPIIRLGNRSKLITSLRNVYATYKSTISINVFESTLLRNRNEYVSRSKKLTELLTEYNNLLDLHDRRETIIALKSSVSLPAYECDFYTQQLQKIDAAIAAVGDISLEKALELLPNDDEEFYKYLYYTSAKYIKRLHEPKYDDLREILTLADDDDMVNAFNTYISQTENVVKLQRVFPIMLTTCISAHRIGKPKQMFDITIIDEAGQCNSAISLVPILRGERLMLVGDPQQLNPVILLNPVDNSVLREKYHIPDEYDYIANSIYKTYLACDSVSDEVLLSYHYRCHKQIIDYNNKKYYNGKLRICSQVDSSEPLVLIDIPNDISDVKNTAPREVDAILKYILDHPDESIGIITPFAKQREEITRLFQCEKISNVQCGTVHAFQGDEKDVILFSLSLTDQTKKSTYEWLKNNRELINVATSRARKRLVLICSKKNIERLHGASESDDLYELYNYVRTNGRSTVTGLSATSRALGTKPYSTETEEAFLTSLQHALGSLEMTKRYSVHKEVPISQVFSESNEYIDLFYTGRFDFVVYERIGNLEQPLLVFELDGKEHRDNEAVRIRDSKKERICRDHNLTLIRVDNTYARRYYYIKDILRNYFVQRKR